MKISTIFFIISLLILPQLSVAVPVINSVTFTPRNIWIGENLNIYVNCTDDQNYTITKVVANFTSQKKIFPQQEFENRGNVWVLNLPSYSFDSPEEFNTVIECRNEVNNITSTEGSFSVSKLDVKISKITDSVYPGDVVTIVMDIRKDGQFIIPPSEPEFKIFIDNLPLDNFTLFYYADEGWVVKFSSPRVGLHAIKILVNISLSSYNPRVIELNSNLLVKDVVEFDFLPDKNSILAGEPLTIALSASEKGSPINLTSNNIRFYINSIECEIVSFDGRVVRILTPLLEPGTYKLKGILTYGNERREVEKDIYYWVKVYGTLKNFDGKPLTATLIFTSTIQRRVDTDAEGKFSLNIPDGKYEVEIYFPEAKIMFKDVDVKAFKDTFKFNGLGAYDDGGLRSAGTYVIEAGFSFSRAVIEMSYNEKYVLSEENLKVFKCDDWNSGNKVCNSVWNEIDAVIDKIRNVAKVEVTTLSAFIIGGKKSLVIQVGTDKNNYFLNEKVLVRGIVKDETGNFVSGAKVRIYSPQVINLTVNSDASGIFSSEFVLPSKEMNLTLNIEASKEGYNPVAEEIKLVVSAKKDLEILAPGIFRCEAGKNCSLEVVVMNSGQKDLRNIILSMDGIPQEFYTFESIIPILSAGNEKRISINFKIPGNSTTSLHTITLKALTEDLEKTAIFGLAIEAPVSENKTTSIPTGLIVAIGKSETILLAIFAIVSFSTAFILRMMKREGKEREEIVRMLEELKENIKSGMKKTNFS